LIRDCVAEFLVARGRDVDRGDLAKRTLVETRHFTKHLVAAVGGQRIVQFDVDAVTTFLDSFPVSARTRLNIRLRLSKFFSFCRSKKWITTNPCADVQIKVRRGEVTILSVDDAEELLRTAEASKFRNTITPYVACCLFGGLRPHEAQQLRWEQINFETATIHVLAHTSKRRESRYVHMEPTVAQSECVLRTRLGSRTA
jgi:integrase